jgi:hypothetical protein
MGRELKAMVKEEACQYIVCESNALYVEETVERLEI